MEHGFLLKTVEIRQNLLKNISDLDLKKVKLNQPWTRVTVRLLTPPHSPLMCSHLWQLRSLSMMDCSDGWNLCGVHRYVSVAQKNLVCGAYADAVTLADGLCSAGDLPGKTCIHFLCSCSWVNMCVCGCMWNRIQRASTAGQQILVSSVQLVMCLFHDASSLRLHSSEGKKK